ncbi:MAG: HEAT repeat domain-containing protein [Candidatus Lokiarchaeia archaeon]|nr:HEAT repeat domain-containing protein [Candidatus Lokiarchaeia archaeon]
MVIEIILLIVFLIFFSIGFYIIYKQVALVKKGEFNNKDRIQCIIYGLIFGLSTMVVFAVAVIYALNSPSLGNLPTLEVNPLALLIPFTISLAYISFYPLIDFLFIALSKETDEGLTPFHKLINAKIINISSKKVIKLIIAIIFYIILFILPPIILTFLGIPFIISLISWMLGYPLMILTFYGSKGYIAGISNAYYHIPDIKRSIFLNFEDSKRGMKQFTSNPIHYIILGVMIFVFVWAWISLIQTVAFFFTQKLAISTMSSVFVFVTLLFGILGYFTRFWGRKIKYRGIDIYFAAFLIASVGINVLVNFFIVNPSILEDVFNAWVFTSEINPPNHILLAWAAVIEEIVLITFTSYFFLAKNNDFVLNIKFSKITQCGQTFDPIPLFTFIKHSNPKIRKHALETINLMFERIPLKNNAILNDWRFKNSILDGICDYDKYSRKICSQLLIQLENDVPEITLPWVIEALESPNYDKSISIARTLLKANFTFIERIPQELILNLIEDSEWRLRLIGLKVLSRKKSEINEGIFKLIAEKLISDPNNEIVVETLNLMADISYNLPIEIIIDKIFHNNDKISAAAIKNIRNLNIKQINRKLLSKFIPLIKNPSSSVRASIFELLAKVGNFKKNDVPLLPFIEGLNDSDEKVRKAALNALEKYYEEQPGLLDIDNIISSIDPNNFEILNNVVKLLGRLWKYDPEKILTTLLIFIKFDNDRLREDISDILTENYRKNPDLILQNVIRVPDVTTYITKGIISKTLIKIGKTDQKTVIPLLLKYTISEDDEVRLNALEAIDGLMEEFIDNLDIKPIMLVLQKDRNIQAKRKASAIISKIAQKDPFLIKPFISEFFSTIGGQDSKVKVVLTKTLLEIAKNSPDIIPIDKTLSLLRDNDSTIREMCVKILGFVGHKFTTSAVNALINIALKDDDWIVREASVSSLGKIIGHVDDKEKIIDKLISLLEDKQNWVRWSVLNILSDIDEINASHIPFSKLLVNLKSTDSKIREASARLSRIYSDEIEEYLDELLNRLGDDSEDVRSSMINSIVEIIKKIGLNRILTKLLENLSGKGSMATQRSIALVLGRTAKYEDEKIKKRVISLLKIRCEMSQDPIICSILQELKED